MLVKTAYETPETIAFLTSVITLLSPPFFFTKYKPKATAKVAKNIFRKTNPLTESEDQPDQKKINLVQNQSKEAKTPINNPVFILAIH